MESKANFWTGWRYDSPRSPRIDSNAQK
jgi:hypothetical protein